MHGGRSEEERAEGGVWLVGSQRHRSHSGDIEDMEVAEVREKRKGGRDGSWPSWRGEHTTKGGTRMGGRSSGVRAHRHGQQEWRGSSKARAGR